MKKVYFSFLLISILQINLTTTSAQLYWSESFGSYAVGQNVMSLPGWAGWDYLVNASAPLTYGNLLSDDNYISNGNKWAYTGGNLIPGDRTAPFYSAY